MRLYIEICLEATARRADGKNVLTRISSLNLESCIRAVGAYKLVRNVA